MSLAFFHEAAKEDALDTWKSQDFWLTGILLTYVANVLDLACLSTFM